MLACEGGHVEVVRSLLAAGAPWNELDTSNHCAGEWASASGHLELASALVDHAVQAELILGIVGRKDRVPDLSYLSRPVRYSGDDTLLDDNNDAVMMSWETPLMRDHARVLCEPAGKNGKLRDVLNVGFGMGIIDGFIQDAFSDTVRSHTIIEAHPDVFEHMRRTGWVDSKKKKNVCVEFGRWQTVLRNVVDANEKLPGGARDENARLFDGVFFDTYGEEWEDMREFHAFLPKIMRPGGVYSYFNGLAPDNIFFHTVYCRLAAKELGRLGFRVSFDVVRVDAKSETIWKGVKRRYWWGDKYFLPTCVLDGKTKEQR
jgi:protein arginine N-methyltransferase 2